MPFNAEEFAENPTRNSLNSLLQAQLKQLVEHLHLTVNSGATKAELRKVLVEYFVEKDLMSEEEASGGTHDAELELQ